MRNRDLGSLRRRARGHPLPHLSLCSYGGRSAPTAVTSGSIEVVCSKKTGDGPPTTMRLGALRPSGWLLPLVGFRHSPSDFKERVDKIVSKCFCDDDRFARW